MIIFVGPRRASVVHDESTAAFDVEKVTRESIPREVSLVDLRPVRAVVEILRQSGGLMPRALLGGIFTPGREDNLVIEVQVSGEMSTEDHSCVSQLSSPLVPGLPDDFAQPVMDGLVRRQLPAGMVIVDRAAFDLVESSSLAFELAAELLVNVLTAMSTRQDVERAVRDSVEAWS